MNRKFVIRVVIPVLIIVELSFIFLTCMSYSNKNVDKIKEISKIDKKVFSVYVMDENGDYQVSEQFPTGTVYEINYSKSSCVDNKGKGVSNEVLTYNGGKLTVTSNQTIFCYLYFDIKRSISIDISTDEVAGVLPSTGGYNTTLSCNDSSYSWNPIYQRIEFSGVSSGEIKCNLDYTKETNSYTTLIDEVESKATTNVNGYRYSGKYPDNWVWFNEEKWRIIGSIPTCTSSGCETSKNLVKIIRNETIGEYVYDASSLEVANLKSDWGSNTLYSLLNTHYYSTNVNLMNGKNHAGCYGYYTVDYQTKPNCNFSGIGILSSSYYGRMVEHVYWNTGGAGKDYSIEAGEAYTFEITNQTISGYIGLMSPSDWGYALDSMYSNTSLMSGLEDKTETNWLFNNGEEWTLNQSTDDVGFAYAVTSSGYITDSAVESNATVRPVLYLDASVYIISGDGTEGNPYQIGM